MREPAPALVVDASILIAAVIGYSAPALEEASHTRVLATTARAVEEARRRIELGMKRPDLVPLLAEIVAAIDVVSSDVLEALMGESERALRDAVASRNGSTSDAHVLALAWSIRADIWSPDRDFAGAGVASWSTPNLMRALAPPDD